MRANSFGNLFTFTTFGESHGPMIGLVIDGCPAGVFLSENDLIVPRRLTYSFVTQRVEKSPPKIISGVFEGKTTGTPIAILLENTDHDSSSYESMKNVYRPGHANFSYLQKFGTCDFRGGGRASARETAARIVAGAIAKKIIEKEQIFVTSCVSQVGSIKADLKQEEYAYIFSKMQKENCFCPDEKAQEWMCELLTSIQKEKDSIGGEVFFCTSPLPSGLGDPVYESLDARLAFALQSIPGVKGFEIGSGRKCVEMRGSIHNDPFVIKNGFAVTETNNAGGVLGGISTGMPLYGRLFFKPASSIQKQQKTLTIEHEEAYLEIPKNSRHDVCIALRALPVVEAMVALVIADAMLFQKTRTI